MDNRTRTGWGRRSRGVIAALLLAVAMPLWAAREDERAYRVDGGDVLEIVIPRYPEFTRQYLVTRQGDIAVDLLGQVEIQGLTPPEIEELLTDKLSQYLRHPEGIAVRVLAKRMVVRVVGHVSDPGFKEVPKEANVQEVLTAAGGPKTGALLTRIVVRRRQGEWVEEIPVDLKAYVEGRGGLPELRNDDEIFVPRVQTDAVVERPLTAAEILDPGGRGRVQVLGAVKQPGQVPLAEDANLLTVLTAAGGWLGTADLTRVRRMVGGEGEAEIHDLQAYLDHGGVLPPVGPGDVISVPSRVLATRTVRVLGAVVRPGPVQLPVDADLQTALAAAGGAAPNGDTRRIKLLRREGDELVRREIDLDVYLRSGDPTLLPELRNEDVIFVPKAAVPLEAPTATVYVFGQVNNPGPYPLVEQRPLLHALAQAGGTLPTADLAHVKIAHADQTGDQRIESFDLQAYQDGKIETLPSLRDGDVITIEPNRVTVVGAVQTPGPVDLAMKATVVAAIAAAGGPIETADLSRVVISRPGRDGPTRSVVNLEQYLYEPDQAPPVPTVSGGDVVAVEAGTIDSRVAYVMGAVNRPGPVTIPGRRASVLYCLASAGGVLPLGDGQQVRILRTGSAGGSTVSFDLDALRTGLAVGDVPQVYPGDVVSVDNLGMTGRGVLVLGAVARQGWYPVRKETQSVIDTIGLAGGLSPLADPSRTRLVRGDTQEVITLDLGRFSQEGTPTPVVHDGDVLVVAHARQVPTLWDDLLRIIPYATFFIR